MIEGLQVTDECNNSATDEMIVTVTECINHAPALVSPSRQAISAESHASSCIPTYKYTVVATDPDSDNLKFSLEESPAESATRRLTKVDLELFPEAEKVIKGRTKKDEYYYTNSIHFAPEAPISFIERVEKQSRFHPLIESGAIIHAFVGEKKPNPSSIFKLIEKCWYNTQCAQITISPEFTICEECARQERGLKENCSYCGSPRVYGITRIVGYYSRVPNWNKSKLGELQDRRRGEYSLKG